MVTDKYLASAHAMQSGVALKMNFDTKETEPKHLRVGINSAMVDTAAIATLLIKKGVFSEAEFSAELETAMEREAQKYADELGFKRENIA